MPFINADYPLASWFLLVVTVSFSFLYALPLLFMPLRWARWFRWKLPEGNNALTVYFGRCLGGLALATIVTVIRAVPDPKANLLLFDLIYLVCGAMTVIHIWGAIERTQPWTEDVEILSYGAAAGFAAWIRFSVLA
jgi:hypothetical protein